MFAMVDLEGIERLELRASEWTLLYAVLARVNPETGLASVSPADIADTHDLHRSAVSRGLHDLVKRRVLIRVRQGLYRVNAWVGFRGYIDDWYEACENEVEPIWKKS